MRVAAIDCGTNTLRLLVADGRPGRGGIELVEVHREMRVVRLGEGVDATGRISSGALDRTWHVLAHYSAILRSAGAVLVRMAATSATRDAVNRDEFTAMVTRTLGQEPEVISGAEEAELSFAGAVAGLRARGPVAGDVLVVDIGGGSTELVVGTPTGPDPVIRGRLSEDIGSVRVTERVLSGDPPTREQISAARAWVEPVVAGALDRLPLAGVGTFVAVSGTATTVAAAALRLPLYQPEVLDLARIGLAELGRAGQALLGMTRAHRAVLGFMHPGRVDVIGAGALILGAVASGVADRTGLSTVTISEHDILDGLALSLLSGPAGRT